MAQKDTHSIHPTEAGGTTEPLVDIGSDEKKEAATGPQFQLQTLYLKDVSFEAPRSPHTFNEEWKKPKLVFDLNIGSEKLTDSLYEVLLHVHLKATTEDDKPIYLVELQQGGVFHLTGFTEEVLKRLISTTCPEILFPYVREAVSSLVARGGFPQMLLPPMNFEAMYAQYLTKQTSGEAANTDFSPEITPDSVKH